jgi:hypothetical protein
VGSGQAGSGGRERERGKDRAREDIAVRLK